MKKLAVALFLTAPFFLLSLPLFPIEVLVSQDIWQCQYPECNETLVTFSDFHNHTQQHISQLKRKCWLCEKDFPTKICNFPSHIYRFHYHVPPCPLSKSLGNDTMCEIPITPDHVAKHHQKFISPQTAAFFECDFCGTLIDALEVKLIFRHYYSHLDSCYEKASRSYQPPYQAVSINLTDPAIAHIDSNDKAFMKAVLVLITLRYSSQQAHTQN